MVSLTPQRGDIVSVIGSPDLWTVTAHDLAGHHYLVRSGDEVRHVTNRTIRLAETRPEPADDFPCCTSGEHEGPDTVTIDRAGIGQALFDAAETVKATGGAVEIHGVRMEACDEYGRTESMKDRAGLTVEVLPVRSRLLREAESIITGDRQASYGDAAESFTRLAALWSTTLGATVTAEQVALCLIQLKVSRLVASPGHADSWLDVAGYAALGGEIAAGA